ncbi:MAG: ATP--guanido phosphotransferase, partial [Dethiobacteria bacterium]
MKNEKTQFISHWMEGTGPYAEVTISSRVRLARNIKDIPFPYLASDSQTLKVQDLVINAVKDHEGFKDFLPVKMDEVSALVKQVMVEKHLISPLLAKESHNSALFLRKDEAVGVMINEEDHVRIQSVLPGLQLEKAWEEADLYDNILEEKLEYSFHERYGYLSSCPTNVGTGLRASVMLHLPALIITKQFNR